MTHRLTVVLVGLSLSIGAGCVQGEEPAADVISPDTPAPDGGPQPPSCQQKCEQHAAACGVANDFGPDNVQACKDACGRPFSTTDQCFKNPDDCAGQDPENCDYGFYSCEDECDLVTSEGCPMPGCKLACQQASPAQRDEFVFCSAGGLYGCPASAQCLADLSNPAPRF